MKDLHTILFSTHFISRPHPSLCVLFTVVGIINIMFELDMTAGNPHILFDDLILITMFCSLRSMQHLLQHNLDLNVEFVN